MRVSHEPGYVLHTRPYRETSLLIDVFTRTYGRITVLAKGIRQLNSRKRSAMMPFSLLSMGWSGKGDLPVLTQAEYDGPGKLLAGRERLCGFYVNELIIRLLHRHDPHVALFDAYDQYLCSLDREPDLELNLRLFEKKLLKELGYALDLEHEADGVTKIDPDADYQYVPTYGAVRIDRAGNHTLALRGATLLAFSEEKISARKDLDECKQLMRGIINHHLGRHRLHARSLFKRSG